MKHPEATVTDPLCECSEAFREFYESERTKIRIPFEWVHDLNLPRGIDYRVTWLDSGDVLIRLRRIPPEPRDAVKVAHELAHILIDLQGFPTTGAADQFRNLSSAVNSMVHDPLVCKILLPYKFNLSADMEREREESKTQLKDHGAPPTAVHGKLLWAVNYVGCILESEAIGYQATDSARAFCDWFDTSYPSVLPTVRDLHRLVRKTGYSTPREMRLLFQRIIHKYRLKGHFKIGPA